MLYNTNMNNLQKVITLGSVLILFLIIVFTVIPNRHNRELEIKPDDVKVSTSTEKTITESNDFYNINIKYPVEIRDVNNNIEKYIKSNLESIKSEWALDGELYKNEIKLRRDFPERPIMKYEYSVSYERFESNSLNTVSYVFKSYAFTGGAHGNTALQTFTFNKNGLVTIEDLIDLQKDNDKKITNIIAVKLKKVLADQYNEEIMNEGLGLTGNNTGFLYQSNLMRFVVLDEGIKFVFEQYQVAPYAAGNPEVLFSWDELDGYLVK